METKLQLFNSNKIRTAWNADEEEWYFSVVDVVQALTDSTDPKQYIKKLRTRDSELSANWGTICTPVEMTGMDGIRTRINTIRRKLCLPLNFTYRQQNTACKSA